MRDSKDIKLDYQQDFHMHTVYSDGLNTPEEMILAAIKKGLKRIAITDHGPLPFPTVYAMSTEKVPAYLDELQSLKAKYADQIEVFIGMEIDYLPTDPEWSKKISNCGIDYCIGSIHDIYSEQAGKYRCIDMDLAELQLVIQELFEGDIKKFATEYYRLVGKAAQSKIFDTIGHLDIIKKFNKSDCLFDEDETWYKELVYDCLDKIKASGASLDLNTAGFDKPVGVHYLSTWIIAAAEERGIKLIFGSDAHTTENVGKNFDKIASVL